MFARALKCPLCDEPVSPTQTTCSCGAVLARRSALMEQVNQVNLRPALSWVCAPALVVLLWWAVAPVPLHGFGLGRLYMLVAVTSAMLAMLIAHQVAEEETHSPLDDYIVADFTPVKWFFALLIVWPVTYPLFTWHFFSENDQSLRKRSWVLAALFLILLVVVALRGKPAPAVQTKPPATPHGTPAEVQPTPPPGAPPAAAPPITAPPPALTPTPVPPPPTPAPVGMTITATPAPTPIRFRVVGQTPVVTPRTQQHLRQNARESGGQSNQMRTGASLLPPGRE